MHPTDPAWRRHLALLWFRAGNITASDLREQFHPFHPEYEHATVIKKLAQPVEHDRYRTLSRRRWVCETCNIQVCEKWHKPDPTPEDRSPKSKGDQLSFPSFLPVPVCHCNLRTREAIGIDNTDPDNGGDTELVDRSLSFDSGNLICEIPDSNQMEWERWHAQKLSSCHRT